MEIKYKMTAKSPLYTGAGNQIGIKSELRKQKVKIKNPTKVISKFINETDRELAFVDVLTMLYAHISPDYRMKRGKDIWKEFKSGLLQAAGCKSISNFISRFASRFDVGCYDTKILQYLEMFDNSEFLQYLTDNIDYLITKMRLTRESKNNNFKKIKEIEKAMELLLIDYKEDDMFGDEKRKKQIDDLANEQKQLETNETGLLFDVKSYEVTNSELVFSKDFEQVPLFSGNSIAGIMRRIVMADYFQRIELNDLLDFTYHTFFTGGSLTTKVENEFTEKLAEFSGKMEDKLKKEIDHQLKLAGNDNSIIDLKKDDALAYYCTPLRLFGSATVNAMVESEMIVSNARLVCKENGNGDISLWSLIEDIAHSRLDSEKTERDINIEQTNSQTQQMQYWMETIIEGAEFEHSFVLKSKDPYIENCFHASLKLFCDYHRIGGKSARGLGDIDLSELEKHIDLLKVKAYYQHLEGNKEEIRRYITGE
ncbi:MAG: hypothetical protein GXX85_14165 [Ignavibacteria bacterium]|nr:hypothetical protein [Ignavibacteria bacterium]